eukprot:205903-Pyramimonas_sp.AAC.1
MLASHFQSRRSDSANTSTAIYNRWHAGCGGGSAAGLQSGGGCTTTERFSGKSKKVCLFDWLVAFYDEIKSRRWSCSPVLRFVVKCKSRG